ncbi:hypothetical protein D1818_15615 [Aquimarina sp. BL5]|uniref:hypothetical protein n=1 Tax=Aquimarina sp. BL5 TaxID=1714860 RepID=UPI000E50D2E9|nr:hypothetical protein [Aquimarina sp. BL5]AXT52194.1 hypothetical protein D1818_15615 [Aquimarina sp. BL5]RKN07695.1 hypothetical protein D7036_07205 [Aquimarina sp. BL5]
MNLKQSILKVQAALGNVRAMEKLHVDTYTEDIIIKVEGTRFASSELNEIYMDVVELAGYYYIKTIVLGSFHIKTWKGATLLIKGRNFELNLVSDMQEIESDFSNVSNRSVTQIDFVIEEQDIDKIEKSRIDNITISSKKKTAHFENIVITDEEE